MSDTPTAASLMRQMEAWKPTITIAGEPAAGHWRQMPPGFVRMRLVPVEVFGGDCPCHMDTLALDREPQCHGWGYGLSDAIPAWSDCNRADGRIYRRDDNENLDRDPGDTVSVWVAPEDAAWFERRFGDDHA